MIKKVILNTLLVLFPFLLLEMVFRFLPVSDPPYTLPVTAENPVTHNLPNQDWWFSKGWDFALSANKHTNNYGYNNQNDYYPDDTSPLLMVIGDSFVEANQVDAGKSVAEILHNKVKGTGRVYSMGVSAAPMSQYLIFAEHSKSTFNPDAMVFFIIANDFDRSLLKYRKIPRFHYFNEVNDDLVLQRVDYQYSGIRRLVRESAFLRYIMLNLEVKMLWKRITNRTPEISEEFVGNMPFTVEKERLDDSKRVVDEFFKLLPQMSGLDSSQILFVIDGMRPTLYSTQEEIERAEHSYFGQMRNYFQEQALSRSYEVIDMHPVFIERHRLDNSRFEFEIDGHWNVLGHQLVAREVEKSDVFKSTFYVMLSAQSPAVTNTGSQ